MRFTIRDGGSLTTMIYPSARAVLESGTARGAQIGAEVRDEAGRVIAVKERLELEDGWILAWRTTEAWSEPLPPIDLEIA